MTDVATGVPAPPSADAAATGSSPDRHEASTVWIERQPDQGRWVLGVTVNGVDHVFAARKLGGMDDDIREAAEPGFKAARADAYQRQILLERG